MTPFEFFHDLEMLVRIDQSDFKAFLASRGIKSTKEYIEWQKDNTTYPSIEDINDGYFGIQYTNFQSFLPQVGRRR
jgi:hypothetical protein